MIRDQLIRLRGPNFLEAYRATLWWLPALLVLALCGRGLVHRPLGVGLLIGSMLIAVYVIFRVVTLERLQHSQREFEPKWLAEQSEALQAQYFEVLRFSVYGRRLPRRTSGRPIAWWTCRRATAPTSCSGPGQPSSRTAPAPGC